MSRPSWDEFYIGLARYVATRSKDPSTKVGAVIVRPDRSVCSLGYNGFPRKTPDTVELLQNREEKYPRTVHAEINALLAARESVKGYTLYVTAMPCARWNCTPILIQAGISRVVCPNPLPEHVKRWGEENYLAFRLFQEAGVQVDYFTGD